MINFFLEKQYKYLQQKKMTEESIYNLIELKEAEAIKKHYIIQNIQEIYHQHAQHLEQRQQQQLV